MKMETISNSNPFISNIENVTKYAPSGPTKSNAPLKKRAEDKRSFLSNTGKTILTTPMKQVLPSDNIGSLIYTDPKGKNEVKKEVKNIVDVHEDDDDIYRMYEKLEFTKPAYKYDNYNKDVIDFFLPELEVPHYESPPSTPPPVLNRYELSYIEDDDSIDCFSYDYSIESIPYDDLRLPDIFLN